MKFNKYKGFLKSVTNKNKRKRTAILKKATKQQLKALCEVLLNVYNLNLPISSQQQKKLSKYKKAVLEILNRKKSWDAKRKIFEQKGGFLPILAPTILSLLASLAL